MKKFISVILAFVMLFSMTMPAFAGGDATVDIPDLSFMADIFGGIGNAISGFFNSIINFFKDLFGSNDNVAYYTITYLDADGTVLGKASYAVGSEISAPKIPEKEGYVFMNWYPAIPDEMPERDITVTAQWAEMV